MTPTSITVENWEAAAGEMTVAAIRLRHLPPGSHRVSEKTYPPGTSFKGTIRACLVYVLRGDVQYTLESDRVRISAGQWAPLPSADYLFEAVGSESAHIVKVWNLSEPS